MFPIYKEYINTLTNADMESAKTNPFMSANLVKIDLFKRFGQVAAAGDRHLVEFLNNSWYLKDVDTIKSWGFGLTTVDWRKDDLKLRITQTDDIVSKRAPLKVEKSDEEFVELMEGLVGLKDFVSNVNLPNTDLQAPYAPKSAVVETNASFTKGKVEPISAAPLNVEIQSLVLREIYQQENLLKAIRERNINDVYKVFVQEPLCSSLNLSDAKTLFNKMVTNTKKYLSDWKL